MPERQGPPSPLDERTAQASGALDSRIDPAKGPASSNAFQLQLDQLDQQRQMIQAKAPEKAGFGDQLLKPENLIKLGLAAAGALSGNDNLMAAGAGLGVGTLEGAAGSVAEQNAERQKHIDDLTKMVDKQQTRLVTLLQTQPGLFVDEQGQAISSQEDWMSVLPIGMQVDVESLVRRKASGGKDPAAQFAAKMMDIGIRTDNPIALADGLRRYYAAAGIEVTEEQVQLMSLSTPENFIDNLLKFHTGTSVTKLILEANKRGLPVMAPELNNLLVMKKEGVQPTTIMEQGVFDAQQSLQEWLKNDDHLVLWEKNRYDALEQAFEGDPVGLAALQDSSKFFNRGTRADEMRVDAEVKMWADVRAMMIVRGGGLGGDPAAMKRLRSIMTKELDATFARGRDVVTIGKNMRTASSAGAAYVAKYPGDKNLSADLVGSQLVVRRNAYIRAAGLKPNEQPNAVTDAFMRASIAYEDMLRGTATEEEYRELHDKAIAVSKSGG